VVQVLAHAAARVSRDLAGRPPFVDSRSLLDSSECVVNSCRASRRSKQNGGTAIDASLVASAALLRGHGAMTGRLSLWLAVIRG
jgi:hypothetical protein